jgi:3-(3-hydroxy-phenyl)propionate hydroxylase
MRLAPELALAKVDVAVVERRPDHVLVGSRAGGFHSRTIEVLDQLGVADPPGSPSCGYGSITDVR